MDKYQFTDELIQNCRRSITVSAIISSYEYTKRNGNNILAICPFHADERMGSFVGTDSKGIWKCFSCGEGGDVIKFVSLKENLDYIGAAYKIGLDYGLITQYDYDSYYTKRRYKADDSIRLQKRYEKEDTHKFENNIADIDILDKVFRLFIKECKLSEEHYRHLKQERGLSDAQIESGIYFTYPTRSIARSFVRNVREEFGSDEVLQNIPGFFWSQEDAKWLFPKHKGIGIPIKNSNGLIAGIQVRRDEAEGKSSRYVWFSSSFAQNHEKFEYGTSSGAPVDVVYPTLIKNNSVIITEGRFKAQILANETGSVVMSVQGTNAWRGIVKELGELGNSSIAQSLYTGHYRPSVVLSAFDSDMSKNVQVFQQLRRMSDSIQDKRYPVYYLYWDEELGKGADDVILNGHKSAIKRYDKSVWDSYFDKMMKLICDTEGIEEKDVKQVKKSRILTYFNTTFKDIQPLPAQCISRFHEGLLSITAI